MAQRAHQLQPAIASAQGGRGHAAQRAHGAFSPNRAAIRGARAKAAPLGFQRNGGKIRHGFAARLGKRQAQRVHHGGGLVAAREHAPAVFLAAFQADFPEERAHHLR